MPWGAAIAAGGALIGSAMQSSAGKKGAESQAQASMAATEEQRRQYDQTRQDLMPWQEAGGWALGQQRNFLTGDTSGFENSPDYAFAVDQGFKGLNRGAAAVGNFGSGGADADRIALGQGLATQYAGNYWNRLAGLSNTGQTTANQLGQFGQQNSAMAGQNAMNAANARASSYANTANAWGNAAGQIGQLGGYAMGNWYQGQQRNNAQGAGTNAINNYGWAGLGSVGY